MKRKRKRNVNRKRKIIYKLSALVATVIVIGSLLVKKVTLIIDGKSKVIYTFANNYGQLFNNRNIEISPEDEISIALGSKIINKSVINFNKSQLITIIVDNKTISHRTLKRTWAEALDEAGIKYDEDDTFSKDVRSEVIDKGEISVNRIDIREEEVVKTQSFDEKIVNDYKTNLGETRVISEGVNGEKRDIYRVTYENGIEIKREIIKEEDIKEPISKVIATGIFDPNSLTVCVNRKRNLSKTFEPTDLVIPNVRMSASASRNMLRPEASTALENLFNAAESEGVYLYAVSGYRSYYYQSTIYNPYSGYSAPPGASEHQLGLAMDVNTGYSGTNLTPNFAYTTEGQWVQNNAYKYGFVVRYMEGKEDITGYNYEPWHLRYLGVDLATELTNEGITLEEYYGEY